MSAFCIKALWYVLSTLKHPVRKINCNRKNNCNGPAGLPFRMLNYIVVLLTVCFVIAPKVFAYTPKKVLIVNSYHKGYFWSDGIMEGIEAEFQETELDVELFFEYMDSHRYKSPEVFENIKELYRVKYKGMQFDVIIVSDDNAFNFMIQFREELFGDVPMVFCGVNDFQKSMLKGCKSITGLIQSYDKLFTVTTALKLHPSAEQLVFVKGNEADHSKAIAEINEKLEKQVRIRTIRLWELSLGEFIHQLETLGEESIVILPNILRDRDGNMYPKRARKMIDRRCAAPIYTHNPYWLGQGVVGGSMKSGLDTGRLTARMAAEILRGCDVKDVPLMYKQTNACVFDFEQLKSFEIPLSALPIGSTVINEPKTFYYQYKARIQAVVAVLVALTLIVIILLVNIVHRKRYEKKLLDYQTQLKSLASQLSLAEEHERRRIAVQLHDQIGQSLVISKFQIEELSHSIPSEQPNNVLKEVSKNLGDVIRDTRLLTFDLSSPILYELGFEAAVSEWLSEQIEKKYGIESEFHDDGRPKPLDENLRVLLFRDVRELLVNVIKHACATKVKVALQRVNSDICVSIEDNGVGINLEEISSVASKTGGFGLFSIRERLEQLGGNLEISSQQGRGCKVILTAPLQKQQPEDTS